MHGNRYFFKCFTLAWARNAFTCFHHKQPKYTTALASKHPAIMPARCHCPRANQSQRWASPNSKAANKLHFRTKSKKRLALEGELLRTMEFYDEDRVVIVAVPQS
jgi:hypothetical protein